MIAAGADGAPCRACAAPTGAPFLRIEGVPTHSNLLFGRPEDARAHPLGTIELVACARCGLIANRAFDGRLMDYSQAYEETQAHSPRFQRFQDEVIAGLIARHPLRGGRVVEVGCGQGEFLHPLCQRAGAAGRGFDPVHRGPGDGDGAVRILARNWGAADRDEPCDLLVCRHTLEHIDDVAAMAGLFAAAVERQGAALFIEVPDTDRILAEHAFWDVYYEHCTYFTAASLAGLVRRAGLRVTRSELAYEGQYLLLEAAAGRGGPAEPAPAAEREAIAATIAATAPFAAAVEDLRRRWRERLGAMAARGQRAVLWGAGSKAVGFLSTVGPCRVIDHVVDINPAKWGSHLPGGAEAVIGPDRLAQVAPDLVVVMNPVYRDEIGADLAARGIACPVVALG